MKKVLTGNHSLSWGAKLSRVQVISAYPITPQTTIVELLSEMVATGQLEARFINVESEHSAMAACIGASAAGARAFTATSAQGLALMHEVLHWAARARLPIVMGVVTRAMAPPWSIWSEQTDFLSQRDTGWMLLSAESNQEALDLVILSYKVAERVYVPAMISLDAFILSHTYEPVVIHDQERVDEFLPPFEPLYNMDPSEPRAWGGLANRDHYYEFSYKLQKSHELALRVFREEGEAFDRIFGTRYELVEGYMLDDAEDVLVSIGAMTSNVRYAVHLLREEGKRVGLLKLRLIRPFPRERVRELLEGRRRVVVLDRNISMGQGGILAQEIRNALYGSSKGPWLLGYIIGLGGRDIRPEHILEIYRDAEAREGSHHLLWHGVKGVPIGPGGEHRPQPIPPLEV